MRKYETAVQMLKDNVLRSVAELAWEDRLQTGVLDIAEQIIPGPNATFRCCIYKERAVINSRVKLAMGGDKSNPGMVEVLDVACDECPVSEITVGPACRGCIATRCVYSCPKGAITMVNHRAVIDQSKCIACGRCLTSCPYGAIEKNQRPCERGCPCGAITMGEDKKARIDLAKCTSCGSCVYQCPFGAIMDKSQIVDCIQLLQGSARWDFPVWAVVAPSIAGQFAPASPAQVAAGLRALGFAGVEEAALGADLVAAEESAELLEKGLLLSSCCPAFVDYVEKNHPDQAHLISHTPSPMVMTARRIKQRHPGARVVFVGPCVAKKKEAQLGKTMGAIDCVLSFEELSALFDSKKIELTALDGAGYDSASGYGRRFAASGGVSAAVARAIAEREDKGGGFQLRPVPCSGLAQCREALKRLAAGTLEGNFIEGMACEGGCVMGPVTLTRAARNRVDVDRHAAEAGERNVHDAAAAE